MQVKLTPFLLATLLATFSYYIVCCNALGCETAQLTYAEGSGEDTLQKPTDETSNQRVQDGDMAFFIDIPTAENPNETETGDSAASPNHTVAKRGATKDRRFLWPNGIIYYNISHFYTCEERDIILKALCMWEEHTCIRFVQRTTESQYITIYPGPGCSSYIGRVGGNQGVSVGRSCFSLGSVLHEIGHAIGFFHEQSRPDRDEHVDIIYDNIITGAGREFRKLSEDTVDSLGVGYDYNSIMHYKHNLFAKLAELDTIVARDPTIPIGGGLTLSKLDIVQTNRLYHCPDVLPPRSITCPAENTPTPIPFPEELPYPNCGGMIEITKDHWDEIYTIESPNYPTYTQNVDCGWFIRVPNGFQVLVTLEPMSIKRSLRCRDDYITLYDSIVAHKGFNIGKYCGSHDDYPLTSFAEYAFVHYHTDAHTGSTSELHGFKAKVEALDINECARKQQCSHKCRNLIGSFECLCPDGFFLSADGRKCLDTNECGIDNGGCDHKCVNHGGWHHCACNQGYTLQQDNKTCIFNSTLNVILSNVCEEANCEHICGVFGDEARCACRDGYVLASDGRQCEDINECASGNGGCAHTCTNTPGSFECSCRKGYHLASDKRRCKDINECATGNGGCDQICNNWIGSFECRCRQGYKLLADGITCEVPIPEELPYPNCGGIIEITKDHWDEIYTIESPNYPTYTQNIDCGWFIRVPKGFQAMVHLEPMSIKRSVSYRDDYIEMFDAYNTIDELDLGQHRGSYRNYPIMGISPYAYVHYHVGSSGSTNGFKGFRAEVKAFDTDECRRRNVCPENFICFNTPGSFKCICPEGFLESPDGTKCEAAESCSDGYARSSITRQCEDINECATQNGGCDHLCTNTVGSLVCSCDKGYYLLTDGKGCQDINECATGNGGCEHNCENTLGSFECSCHEGYKLSANGETCEDLTVEPPSTAAVTAPLTTGEVAVATTEEEEDNIPIPQCGAILRDSRGSFKTPNWPQTYPTNVLCEWTIVLPDDKKRVEITFKKKFGIAGNLPECAKDWVKVYDGLDDAEESGPYCHYKIPPKFVSSGHEAKVVLFAGPKHNAARGGFSATYRSV